MIANYRQAVPVGEPEPEINFVEYIQSSGTQYIDTGFMPNNNTRVVMDVEPTKAGTYAVFGARLSQSATSYTVWMISSTSFRSDFNRNQKTISVSNVLTRVVIDRNKNVCKIGQASTTNSNSTFQLSYNMFLLALNEKGTCEGRNLSGKLYSCQIYDNDVLIRDYAPALDPDGVACLYDKVSEEYVYNAGTGSFATP